MLMGSACCKKPTWEKALISHGNMNVVMTLFGVALAIAVKVMVS